MPRGLQFIILLISAGSACAQPQPYQCAGVDYRYPQGIGAGSATRQSASRKLWLDGVSNEIRLQVGRDILISQYTRDAHAYHARFSRNGEVGGVRVAGLRLDLDRQSLTLQTAHILDDGRNYLAFTGTCHPLQMLKTD